MNNFQNRLLGSVSLLDLFPSLGEAKGGFIPSLSLQLFGVAMPAVGIALQLVHLEVDSSFCSLNCFLTSYQSVICSTTWMFR